MSPGQRLLHYRLIERIGRGGMGDVYRALDTRLDRHVALEVLPPEVAADSARLDRPEILRWRARMWIDGGRQADRARTIDDLAAARSDYERLGMPRHVTLVDRALAAGGGGEQ